MQQKVAICCSIIHNPKVVILDEPTLGLDFESVKIMEEVIKNLISKDRSIIVTSNDLDFISNIANHVVVINKGKKVLDSPISLLDSLKEKNYFEIEVPYDANIFDDSRIVEVSQKEGVKSIRFALQSPYEVSDIINKFKEGSIPILNMKQSDYSLADLYMDLVKENERSKEVTQQ